MTLDTNIVIAYLAGEEQVIQTLSSLKKKGRIFLLPTIVEAEILAYPLWSAIERTDAERFLEENFHSIPFDRTIARAAAEIRRATKIKFPDAAIAATALVTRTILATRNVRDFRKIPDIQLFKL